MVGSKSSIRRSSNVSSSSKASKASKGSKGRQGSKGRRKRKDKSDSRPPVRVFAVPCYQTAPRAARSAALYTDPKMNVLQKFVRKVAEKAEPAVLQEHTPQISLFEADSFGDEEPSREQHSELDSGSDLSPVMLASRRGSASSTRRSSAAYGGYGHGGYSRRTSAAVSSRRTSAAADSRRTSAYSTSSYMGKHHSEESASLPKAVLQTTFESIAERQTSHDSRRNSFRPASASAVLQRTPERKPEREVGVGQVNQRVGRLVEEAQKQRKQQIKQALSLDQQVAHWMAEREAAVQKQEAVSHSRISWRAEHEALEAKRKQLQFFDMKGVKDNFMNRCGHSLRKLFVDFDLAHNSGHPEQSHEARCKHLDGIYDWYERHAALKGRDSGPNVEEKDPKAELRSASASWIFVKHGEAPPPGSLRRPRSAVATFAGSGASGSGHPPRIPRTLSAPSFSGLSGS